MAVIVRISARTIRWPPVCPCCLDPADDVLEIGDRFNIPYCSTCFAHAALLPELLDAEDDAADAERVSRYFLPAGGAVLAVVLVALFLTHPTGQAVVAAIVAAGIATLVVLAVPPLLRRRAAARRQLADHVRLRYTGLARRRCCRRTWAIAYLDRYATEHEFAFANPGYAAAFMNANESRRILSFHNDAFPRSDLPPPDRPRQPTNWLAVAVVLVVGIYASGVLVAAFAASEAAVLVAVAWPLFVLPAFVGRPHLVRGHFRRGRYVRAYIRRRP